MTEKKATRTKLHEWFISDLENYIQNYSILKAISPQMAIEHKNHSQTFQIAIFPLENK